MNSDLERRLRKLEARCAEEINRNRDIKIVWVTKRPVSNPRLQDESNAAPDASKGCDPPTLDDPKTDDGP
jgi:hypothetical protein